MFHGEEREAAVERMNKEYKQMERHQKNVIRSSEHLYRERDRLKKSVFTMWDLINSFREKPTELNVTLKKVKIEYDRYEDLISEAEVQADELEKVYGGAVSAVAIGGGVAALGPSVAMSIATTFGTASTGTAISALSGVAARNAALAWLGGGTLAAGGGGTALGSTILGLAGPVGWGIAAAGIVGGSLMANGKNKKAIAQANEATKKIEAQSKILEGTAEEIRILRRQTSKFTSEMNSARLRVERFNRNFNELSETEQDRIVAIVNNVFSASKMLNKTVGQK